jgi:hypothetical protein
MSLVTSTIEALFAALYGMRRLADGVYRVLHSGISTGIDTDFICADCCMALSGGLHCHLLHHSNACA